MLHVPFGGGFGLVTPSWGTTRPAAANGVSVTPSTTNAYGTYVQLHAATTADAYGIWININTNAGSAASRASAIQIGIDEAGGTAYVARIPDLLCGGASSYTVFGGFWYYFPLYIPKGSSVAVAARGSVATAFNVGTILNQEMRDPSSLRMGTFAQAIGVTLGAATAAGVTIVPGTTAEGAWTAIGPVTTRRMWWWQFAFQTTTADTAWSAQSFHVDIAVGNATTKDIMFTDMYVCTDAAENMIKPAGGGYYDVPAGSQLYARVQASGTLDAHNLAIYGLGG